MATQTIAGGLIIPRYPQFGSATATPNSAQLITANAVDDQAGYIVQFPKSGNVRKIGTFFALIGGTTSNFTLDCRIETLTTGLPSGTLWGTNTNGTLSLDPAADDNKFVMSGAFTADAAVTKGAYGALVWKVTAVPSGGSPSLQMGNVFADDLSPGAYGVSKDSAGAWTKDSSFRAPICSVEYDDGTTSPIINAWAMQTITTTTINSGSGSPAFGLRFLLPFPARITGGWVWIDFDAAFQVELYEGSSTTLASTTLKSDLTFDADIDVPTAGHLYHFHFDNTVELTANTVYRMFFEPTTVTDVSLYDYSVDNVARMAANSGGSEFYLCTHDGTTITDTTTRRPFCGIRLDGFSDGVGAGGGGGVLINGGLVHA